MLSYEMVELSAREVLETTAGVSIDVVDRTARPDGDFEGLIATISLAGARGGTLVVYCHPRLAAQMAAGMLGMETSEVTDDTLRDALGELINQIGGTVKRRLQASGAEMMLSVPVVVGGPALSHKVRSTASPLCLRLRLGADNLSVCMWPA